MDNLWNCDCHLKTFRDFIIARKLSPAQVCQSLQNIWQNLEKYLSRFPAMSQRGWRTSPGLRLSQMISLASLLPRWIKSWWELDQVKTNHCHPHYWLTSVSISRYEHQPGVWSGGESQPSGEVGQRWQDPGKHVILSRGKCGKHEISHPRKNISSW